ncbi:nuclear pore complex protein Nup214 [Anopheles ziemanni]|uniref:nuclear pore complex protein Nup214 n=1 Tax=Anopheles ziemanni TaxID=345580 RepID=UPI00265E4012|nr:nuclear pore complex protein Nup214 [Anopheles ziemanni]
MAQQAPEGLDVTELMFKLQSKVPLFKGNGNAKDNCNLLAAASVHGLVFAGTVGPELRVLRLKDITTGDRAVSDVVPLRTVQLPSEAFQLAVSCDHGFLAVDVVGNGGVPFIYIYSVPSFLTGSVVKLHEIRTSPQPGVRCSQICWNPVIHNMFSVRTETGGLSVYTLKEPTGLEFHSLDANAGAAQCACWSPKGKQLVVAFANGKLVQYKPDLKPARTIVCPPGVVEGGGGYDVLAVQWLSTYQFAAVFLPHAPDSVPALFIVNAPKVGNPILINYDDVCYSQSGPRKGQVFLLHILPWNLLLMASANSMEVGILGTTETGEAPTWCQWTTTDEARAELPLTADKQESFPIGFALETGCTHELVIGEQAFPVMPMIHLLSTYGQLVSFNVLNKMPNVPNICSPPKPAQDLTGGAFVMIDFDNSAPPQTTPSFQAAGMASNANAMASQVSQQQPPHLSEISFAVPSGATSTPAIPKTKSFFNAGLGPGDSTVPKSPLNLFGSVGSAKPPTAVPTATTIAPTFGKQITFGGNAGAGGETKTSPFGGFASPSGVGGFGSAGGTTIGTTPSGLPTMSAPPFQAAMASMAPPTTATPTFTSAGPADANKPLVTVPPTYVPPASSQQQQSQAQPPVAATGQQTRTTRKSDVSSEDNNAIIRAITVDELKRFSRELVDMQQRNRSVNVQIGSKEESAGIIRNLRELEDIIAQANESTQSLVSDVQALRLGLNEAFAMVAEANSKSAIYNNPSLHQYQEEHVMSQASRRQLSALENMLQVNENQLRTVTKQLGAQWMAVEEAKRAQVRQRMHIPSLEVLYQTLSKQQEILNRQCEKLGYLKHRLGLKSTLKGLGDAEGRKALTHDDSGAIESLTDSILSMTLGDQVAADAKKLSEVKLAALRKALAGRKVVTVKPKRPDRVGLSSEVVRERRDEVRRLNLEQEKSQKAQAAKKEAEQKKQQPQQQQPQQQILQQQSQQPVAKPLASSTASNKPFSFPAQAATGGSAGMGSFSFGQTTITPMTADAAPPSKPIGGGGNISTGLSFGASNKENMEKKDSGAKENVAPKPSAAGLFSFGSSTAATGSSPAAFKSPPETSSAAVTSGVGMTGKSVFSFAGAGANTQTPSLSFGSVSKPTFSFDPSSASTPSTLSFGSGSTGGASEAPLNLGKPKQTPVTNENIPPVVAVVDDETRKDKPLPPSFGPVVESNTTTKAPLPALTSLLQKVDPTAATVDGSQTKVTSTTKGTTATSTGLFGSSGAGSTFGEGSLFGSKSNTTATGDSAKSGGFFSGLTFGGTTITPVVASSGTSTPTTASGGLLFGGVKPAPPTTKADGTPPNSGFSFGSSFTPTATVTPPSDQSKPEEKKETVPAASSTVSSTSTPPNTVTVISTGGFSFGSLPTLGKSLPSPSAPDASTASVASPTTPPPSTITAPATADPTAGLFGSISICSPTTTAIGTTSPQTPPSSGGNIFSSSAFGAPQPGAGTSTASIFGGSATAGTGTSIFGAVSKPAAGFGVATTPVASTASTGGSGLFGSVVAPSTVTSTAVASSGGSLFGATSTSTTTTTAGSIFGGGATSGGFFSSGSGGTATTTTGTGFGGGSIFGASASSSPSTPVSSGNIFGGSSAAPSAGGGIFGNNNNSAASGGSIFGGTSAFGASSTPAGGGGNIFGSPAATSTQSSWTGGSGLFGSVGANTGSSGFTSPQSPAAPSQTTQSIFGGGATAGTAFGAAPTPTNTVSAFGSPSGGGASAFSKPVSSAFGGTAAFGSGTPTFGGAATFGGAPTFGGGPTFGSPKATFGGGAAFGVAPAATAIGSPTQSNNLFEQLGSSSTSVSFGGLAQQQATKPPQFGGSSFSSWRS